MFIEEFGGKRLWPIDRGVSRPETWLFTNDFLIDTMIIGEQRFIFLFYLLYKIISTLVSLII